MPGTGGIESTAFTGGGLTPPVMGVAIFIMPVKIQVLDKKRKSILYPESLN
jgi:hypothetical protein